MRIRLHACVTLSVALLLCTAAFAGTDLRLVTAAENRDLLAVRSLLEQHSDPNAAQADGATALAWAAHWDDLEMADVLIRAGANPNAANDYGVTPLFLACTNRSAAMAEKLLSAGANPTARLLNGQTVLMSCSRTGNAEAVNLLLSHGAQANVQDPKGHTALMWAIAERHADVTKTLVEHGADIHARSKGGFTPLLFAAQQGDLESARILVAAGADPNESTQQDGNTLVLAAASGHEAVAIFLLENGADPNAKNIYGLTALHYTAHKGLAPGNGVEYKSYRLPPPSMPDLAKALLAHKAEVNATMKKDFPAYTYSPIRPPLSMVGATPFFVAAAAGDANIMRILAAGGADPLAMVKGKTTPLMAAAGVGQSVDFELTQEGAKEALEAVKVALELGGDLNAVNDKGQTALHGAAAIGADAVIQFLVEKGADVNAKDKLGQTPWSIATGLKPPFLSQDVAYNRHDSAANLLLKLGATPMTAKDFPVPARTESNSRRPYTDAP